MERYRSVLFLAGFLILAGDLAGAAPVRSGVTNAETPLFQRPGEASRKLAVLARGTEVEILRRQGRWLEARAAGKRGWLPRSTVEQGSAPEPERTDRAELVEVVKRRVRGRAAPSARAALVFEASSGDALRVAGRGKRRGWILVENDRGLSGWVNAGGVRSLGTPAPEPVVVAVAQPARAVPDREAPEPRAIDAGHPAGPGRAGAALSAGHWVSARAGIGVGSVGQDFSSDGTTELSGYRIAAGAMAASSEIEAGKQLAGRLSMAADVRYQVAVGIPGIRYQPADGSAADPVGFAWHEIDAGGRAGVRLGRNAIGYARLGFHFGWFQVDQVNNAGLVGRESLSGPTAGVGLVAALGGDFLLRVAADALVGGKRRQTPGLEDGERSSARAAWGRVEASYLAADSFAIEGAYRLGWASTEWNGASPRQPDVMHAVRNDISHALLVGVQKRF